MKKALTLLYVLVGIIGIIGIGVSSAEDPSAAPAAVPPSIPIKFSLWNKIAMPENDLVHGVELGIGSYTPGLKGFGWNLIFMKTDDALGFQKSFVTVTKLFTGLQCGAVNLNSGSVCGMQFGFFNKAKSVEGFQIGFVNMAGNMRGVQIGLVNFIKTGYFPAMIIVNAKF